MSFIGSVVVPSLGPTLDGVIQGIGRASELGTSAVGDAVQLFTGLALTAETPTGPADVGDLGSYPDPTSFLGGALPVSESPLSDFVPTREVLARLTDPDFNFNSALDDALDGFLGERGLVTALSNPKWAENMKIDKDQFQSLQTMQSFVKEMLTLSRSVARDMRA